MKKRKLGRSNLEVAALGLGFIGMIHYVDESVSVALKKSKSPDWVEKVYKPDIQTKWDTLYKPGYDPNDL